MTLPAYQPQSDLLPLSDAELEQLDLSLAALPDSALTLEALDGYLSALLLSPQPLHTLPGEAWLPTVWGQQAGEPDPFASSKQRKKLQLLVLRHARALHAQLGSTAWEPLFSVVDDGQQEWVDAEDWCTGFLLAVDNAGDTAAASWAARFGEGPSAAALAPLVALGGDPAQLDDATRRQLDDPAARDALAHAVVEGLRAWIPAWMTA